MLLNFCLAGVVCANIKKLLRIAMGIPSQTAFSIVIPVYNAGKYIRRCYKSICSQTYLNYEIVFVDDGSTDNSAEIMESFKDNRVRVIRLSHKGVSAARNRAIRESRNSFIAFLDADDEWHADHLETIAFLISCFKDGGIYSTGFMLEYEDASPPVEIFLDTKERSWMVCQDPFKIWSVQWINNCSNSAVRKEVLEEAGGFREGEPEGEDLDLWVRIGVRRPLVVGSKITSVCHQVSPVGKPRFRDWPKYVLPCRTASTILLGNQDGLSINRHSIAEYIRVSINSYFWQLVYSNAREPLNVLLANSDVEIWAPIYYWLGRAPFVWPFLRFIGWIKRPLHSRLVLLLRGGSKQKNGVVVRLSKKKNGSWVSYIIRKRGPRVVLKIFSLLSKITF